MSAYPEWLLRVTHQIRYNPNCNKRFEVRLAGKGRGRIWTDERDRVGFGETLEEAAEEAGCPRS